MEPIVILTHGKTEDLDEFIQTLSDKGMQATVLNTAEATLTDILSALAGSDEENEEQEEQQEKPEGETEKKPDGESKDEKKSNEESPKEEANPEPEEETFEEGYQMAHAALLVAVSDKYATPELHGQYSSMCLESAKDTTKHNIKLTESTELGIFGTANHITIPLYIAETKMTRFINVKLVQADVGKPVLKINRATLNNLR